MNRCRYCKEEIPNNKYFCDSSCHMKYLHDRMDYMDGNRTSNGKFARGPGRVESDFITKNGVRVILRPKTHYTEEIQKMMKRRNKK